jgi:hypothetical protein
MLLVLAASPTIFMIVLVAILVNWPPNSVNRMYGYRTRRSMASQEAWDYAQARSLQIMRQWTIWMVAWTPFVLWCWDGEPALLVLCGLMTTGVLLPLWFVERELKAVPFCPSGSVHRLCWFISSLLVLNGFGVLK